jgi:hypothetical protein
VAGVEETQDAFTRLAYVLAGLRDQFVAVIAPAIQFVTDQLTAFIAENVDAQGSLETFARETIADFILGLSNITAGIAVVTGVMGDFGNKIIELHNVLAKFANKHLKELGVNLEHIEFRFGDTAIKMDEYTNFLVALADQTRNATGAQKDFNKELEETPNIFQRISDAMQIAVNLIPEIDQLITDFTRGAMNSFTNSITGAKSFADAVKDMARSIINSLIKMLIQYYITKPLFDFITGSIGRIGSGGGGGGFDNTGAIGGLAVGGPASAGRPYMVGENGPELFVPSAGGQVVPNGRMGGGATVNQTINISTGVAQTVRAEVLNLMPQIAESAKAAVADSRMRGGGYSKALLGA